MESNTIVLGKEKYPIQYDEEGVNYVVINRKCIKEERERQLIKIVQEEYPDAIMGDLNILGRISCLISKFDGNPTKMYLTQIEVNDFMTLTQNDIGEDDVSYILVNGPTAYLDKRKGNKLYDLYVIINNKKFAVE